MQCGPGALHVQERIQLPLTSVHVLILLPIRARITVSVHWSDTSDSPRLLKIRLARLRSVGEKMAGSCERFGQTAIHAGGSLGWAISLSINFFRDKRDERDERDERDIAYLAMNLFTGMIVTSQPRKRWMPRHKACMWKILSKRLFFRMMALAGQNSWQQ